jgi:hypothetical protein
MAYNPFPTSSPGPLVPNISSLLYQGIGNLGEDYYQGQRNQREQAMAQPVIDPSTNQPLDPNSPDAFRIIGQRGMKEGGMPWAQGMMPLILGREILRQEGREPDLNSPDSRSPGSSSTLGPRSEAPQPPRLRSNVANASGPSNVRTNDQIQPAELAQDVKPGTTVADMARLVWPGENSSTMALRYASALQVKVDTPLYGERLTRAKAMMARTASATPMSATDANVDTTPVSGRAADYSDRSTSAGAEMPSSTVSTSASDAASTPVRVQPGSRGVSGGPGPAPSNAPETTLAATGIAPHGLPSTPVAEGTIQRQGNETAPVRVAQAGPTFQPSGPVPTGAPTTFQRPGIVAPAANEPASSVIPRGWRGNEQGFIAALEEQAGRYDRYATAATIAKQPATPYTDKAKALREQAKTIRDSMLKSREPTDAEKERAAAGISDPAEYAAYMKTAEAVGAAKGKRISEIVEGGGKASYAKLRTINFMQQAVEHGGKNITFGPGSELWLKFKQSANNLLGQGFFNGVPESEVLQKLNAALAAESTQSLSPRPSQLEFRTFIANNPGLLTSEAGTRILLNYLAQTTHQDINLSRHAMNEKNWKNWSDVEDKFYADPKNAIIGPWSKTIRNPQTGERKAWHSESNSWVQIPNNNQ